MFSVSVASKEFSRTVSLFIAALTGKSISVAPKGLVGQVGTGVQSGVSACPDPVGISTPQPQSSVDLDVQKWKRWRVDSDGRTAGGEDGDVADEGRRPLLRHGQG